MDDHVRDLGVRPPDPLLDVARERVRLGERPGGVHPEGEERDEPDLGVEEAELAGLGARGLEHDLPQGFGLGLPLPRRHRARDSRLGERLEVGLDGVDLGQPVEDLVLDGRSDLMRLGE